MRYGQLKFTRDQLVFITESIFSAAIDNVHQSLPSPLDVPDYDESRDAWELIVETYKKGVMRSLQVLYTQVTGDARTGIPFVQYWDFSETLRHHILGSIKEARGGRVPLRKPTTRHLANDFVDNYLRVAPTK